MVARCPVAGQWRTAPARTAPHAQPGSNPEGTPPCNAQRGSAFNASKGHGLTSGPERGRCMLPRRLFAAFALSAALGLSVGTLTPGLASDAPVGKRAIDLRSHGRQVADFVAQHGLAVGPSGPGGGPGGQGGGPRGAPILRNVQVNDGALDNIQTFPPALPFEEATQSETSVVTVGDHVVVGYNSSANQPIVQVGGQLFFTRRLYSAYSVSHDGGRTWQSGFVPPSAASVLTFGDPALTSDRAGNLYYSGLAADAALVSTINVNKSTDGGTTFGPGVIVTVDAGADKPWIAAGPDPASPARDNLY